jgi:hypothetical protein
MAAGIAFFFQKTERIVSGFRRRWPYGDEQKRRPAMEPRDVTATDCDFLKYRERDAMRLRLIGKWLNAGVLQHVRIRFSSSRSIQFWCRGKLT